MPNEIAVFTSICGYKDNIRKHYQQFSNCDFFFFTYDDIPEDNAFWKIVKIPKNSESHNMNSQEVKLLSHKFVPEGYKYHVWTDGNIALRKHPQELIENNLKDYDILSMLHPARDDIIDEMIETMRWGLPVHSYEAFKSFLEQENYPRHNGLAATGVVIRPVNEKTIAFNNLMWKLFSTPPNGHRDQFYFNYCLWKLNMTWTTIGYLDRNIMDYQAHRA